MKSFLKIFLLIFFISPIIVLAQSHSHKSKYVGEEQRKIKSLSADDISELKKGGGWGLAKAAELNGVPGPAHILELEKQIGLTDLQKQEIQKVFEKMRSEAIPLGEKLIQLEEELNSSFANQEISQDLLESSISKIERVRAKLRIVHLSAHLKTSKILTNEQIKIYNELRGYKSDPCKNIPEGHNPKMWKKHNNCE